MLKKLIKAVDLGVAYNEEKKRIKKKKHTSVHRSSLITEHHAIDPKCVQATRVSGRINWLHTYLLCEIYMKFKLNCGC